MLILFICLFCTLPSLGQPGWAYKLDGNLNNIDSVKLKNCLDNPNLCHMGIITIDSSTDLSRIVHLKSMKELVLEIKTDSFPSIFSKIEFPDLTSLVIYGCNRLKDLKNIQELKNLNYLQLSEFGGETINIDATQLTKLFDVKIFDCDHLIQINELLDCKSIKRLRVAECDHIEDIWINPVAKQ